MTVREAINEYLIDQQIRGNSDKTVEYYRLALLYFERFILTVTDDIGSVTVSDCKQYYLSLKAAEKGSVTIQSYIRALRAFVTWNYENGYNPTNISERFKLPKAKRPKIDVLTDSEIETLMSSFDRSTAVGLRNYCICALMVGSGLRMNEVVTLTRGHVHLDERYIIVDGKGNKQRFVPLSEISRSALSEYLAFVHPTRLSAALFEQNAQNGFKPITLITIKQLFRRLKVSTGIERLHPHLLRHTFATKFIEYGGDIYTLRDVLGHTSLEMVKRYVHNTPEKTVERFKSFSPLDISISQKAVR